MGMTLLLWLMLSSLVSFCAFGLFRLNLLTELRWVLPPPGVSGPLDLVDGLIRTIWARFTAPLCAVPPRAGSSGSGSETGETFTDFTGEDDASVLMPFSSSMPRSTSLPDADPIENSVGNGCLAGAIAPALGLLGSGSCGIPLVGVRPTHRRRRLSHRA
mmetsp:Transcript_16978/g.59381  ORF Transcript_16978/g.59381 Transcript_16978/m.59381 type:complete len:159 (+) Transcript_16978:2344-2820(+)